MTDGSRIQRARLLVADDEPTILKFVHRFLSSRFEVHTAVDGLAALALADRLVFDLAVLDVQMPGCSGLEVARDLLRRPSPPAVLLVSSIFADPTWSAELSVPEGVFTCLAKPFGPLELLKTLDLALLHRNSASAESIPRLG